MSKEVRKHIESFKKFLLKEGISDERRGKGNSIDLTANDFNVIYRSQLPDYLYNMRDTAVNYWEETNDFMKYEKENLERSREVFTTQKYLSKSFIDSLDDETYEKSDIILVEDKDGNLWIMDGHHRLVFDRIHDRDSSVYIIPFSDVEEIDNIWYSRED